MKVVILAGGFGTRISEETQHKPKPMIELGGKPIIWHIMKIYSYYGLKDFIICCGYKGYVLKEYFNNYFLHQSDISFNMDNNKMKVHKKGAEKWNVTLVDTGENTMTGGRLKRIKKFLSKDEPFCFTYGDGVANVDISKLLQFHKNHGMKATLTATYPPARFGALKIINDDVKSFKEKPKGDGVLINGGFFVLNYDVLDHIEDDSTVWEKEPLEKLSSSGNLKAYKHLGFWQPMDTLKDKKYLETLWNNDKAPWKLW